MVKRVLFGVAALAVGFVLAVDARADVVEAEEVIVGEEAPPPAPAVEPEPDYNRLGPYAGLGASYYISNTDFEFLQSVGDTWGLNARAGWRFLPYVAAEAVYEYASNFPAHMPESAPPDFYGETEIPSHVFTVNAKGILPLGRVQPYLGGGIGFVHARIRDIDGTTQTEFAGRVAVGSDVFLTECIGLFIEGSYLLPTDVLSGLNYFGINFGGKVAF